MSITLNVTIIDALKERVDQLSKDWLDLPVDDDHIRSNTLLSVMSGLITWTLCAPVFAFILSLNVFSLAFSMVIALMVGATFMLIAGLLAIKRNIKLAGLLALFFGGQFIAMICATTGGMNSPAMMLFMVLFIETGFLVKKRLVLAVSAIVIAVFILGLAVVTDFVGVKGFENSTISPLFILLIMLSYGFMRALSVVQVPMIDNDMIDNKKMMAELSAHHITFDQMVSTLPGLITCHDVRGDVVSVHGLAPDSLSARADNLLGQGFFKQIHVSDRIEFLSAMDKLRQGKSHEAVNLRFENGFDFGNPAISNQQFTHMQVNLIAIRDHEDALQKFYIQSLDITDYVKSEKIINQLNDAVSEADHNKTRFLAKVSHELRTPLNSIMGFADILIHDQIVPLPDERAKEYVGLIHESGKYLLNVINAMLDMSKIQNGQYTLYNEPFEFSLLLTRIKAMLDIQAQKKKIQLNCRTAKYLPEITADSRAIQQILINLIGNAIKFTENGGVITVDAKIDDQGFVLSVCDTGIGIPDKMLSQIGQPFLQVNSSYARQAEGTGLGISLVKGLVKLHKGEFDIQSVEGKGTKITITIPQIKACSDNLDYKHKVQMPVGQNLTYQEGKTHVA